MSHLTTWFRIVCRFATLAVAGATTAPAMAAGTAMLERIKQKQLLQRVRAHQEAAAKAANVPLVPGRPLPEKLFQLKNTLIVGLLIAPDRLIQIRRNRLLSLKETRESSYIDQDSVREEVIEARRLYERHGWPTIDVTRRSVEETAAAVLNLLHKGHGQVEVLG